MFTDPFSTVDHLFFFLFFFFFFAFFFFFFEGGALVNTDATTHVLKTPRSSPVYRKQEVVLQEPIPEWVSMITEELGSQNDIFV